METDSVLEGSRGRHTAARAWRLEVRLADFTKAIHAVSLVDRGDTIELSFRKGDLTVRRGRYAMWAIPATGTWPNRVAVTWRYLRRYVDVPPTDDPLVVCVRKGALWFGSTGTKAFAVVRATRRTQRQFDLPLKEPSVGSGNVDPFEAEAFPEGELMYRAHLSRERNHTLVERVKHRALARNGKLECEACGVDLEQVYGDTARGYIECHHIVPLSLTPPRHSRLSDLALLCANCHRMIHRRRPWLTRKDLHLLVRARTSD